VLTPLGVGEQTLRREIQKLQNYRRLGLRTAADIAQYEEDVRIRVRSLWNLNFFI
jgi:hypothetical protein